MNLSKHLENFRKNICATGVDEPEGKTGNIPGDGCLIGRSQSEKKNLNG